MKPNYEELEVMLQNALDKIKASQEQEPVENALFLIYYDDRDMKPEVLVGKSAARARFEQVSISWNAHLFGKIASNSKDSQLYDANYVPPIPPELAELHRENAELHKLLESKVPEGWQLVPIDPTPEMIAMADRVDWSHANVQGNYYNLWQLMISASPEQPKEQKK